MKRMTMILGGLILFHSAMSQMINMSSRQGERAAGVGWGLPYGGVGLRFGYNVMDRLNLFAGAGYQMAGIGYNVGVLKDFEPIGVSQLYLTGMYGTNVAISVMGVTYDNRLYLGPSFGGGIKVNSRRFKGNYWDLGILYPITSSKYQDDLETARNSSVASRLNDPWPVRVIIGYNFNL